MLLVNLQLATTSTVDGFQPVIEVAVTYKKNIFFNNYWNNILHNNYERCNFFSINIWIYYTHLKENYIIIIIDIHFVFYIFLLK